MESDLNNISIVTATTTTAAKAAPISGAEKGVDSSQTSSTHRGNDIDDSHIKVQVWEKFIFLMNLSRSD